MEFKNKENELITKETIGERKIHFSRSVAVLGVIIAFKDDKTFVLIEQRGKAMDEPFKWCVPCGYLDWNENGTGAIFREIYEETNLNLDEFINNNKLVYEKLKQPWYVSDNPHSSNRENVTLRYGCCVNTKKLPELSNINVGKDETLNVKWVDTDDIVSGKYNFAFNHDKIIMDFIKLTIS